MRETFSIDVERARTLHGKFASQPGARSGVFVFNLSGPDPMAVICSDGRGWAEEGLPGLPWEHVSVSHRKRSPSWNEMCVVKNLFWHEEETVMQIHPPQSQWINNHEFCLHLWKPSHEIILPPSLTVGHRSVGE
jgi:hypothetical protein